MTERYNKDFLVREISAREHFTQGDVEIILNCLRDVIEEIVCGGDELTFVGLFKIYVKKMKKHKSYSIKDGKSVEGEDKYRLVISPSAAFKKLVHDEIRKENFDPPENEEE